MKITNYAPDSDAISIDVSHYVITISRDENQIVIVSVEDKQDGHEHKIVLGEHKNNG